MLPCWRSGSELNVPLQASVSRYSNEREWKEGEEVMLKEEREEEGRNELKGDKDTKKNKDNIWLSSVWKEFLKKKIEHVKVMIDREWQQTER